MTLNGPAKLYKSKPTKKNLDTLLKACSKKIRNIVANTCKDSSVWGTYHRQDLYAVLYAESWILIQKYINMPTPDIDNFVGLLNNHLSWQVKVWLRCQKYGPQKIFNMSSEIMDSHAITDGLEKQIENKELVEKIFIAVKDDPLMVDILDLMLLGVTSISQIKNRLAQPYGVVAIKVEKIRQIVEQLLDLPITPIKRYENDKLYKKKHNNY